uniref:Uncharacterized protein n=1 Tax=Zea mays TaxID=4577 RepID=C4IZB4_MAIZE|nr:unknown [Zea mays]ACR35753.1 unknown [Zea mays]ACR36389.1 unknown [Zea mays]ACR36521.1 unknown [Zea mays]
MVRPRRTGGVDDGPVRARAEPPLLGRRRRTCGTGHRLDARGLVLCSRLPPGPVEFVRPFVRVGGVQEGIDLVCVLVNTLGFFCSNVGYVGLVATLELRHRIQWPLAPPQRSCGGTMSFLLVED